MNALGWTLLALLVSVFFALLVGRIIRHGWSEMENQDWYD